MSDQCLNFYPNVLDSKNLSAAIKFYKSKNLKIVFTNGCFDLLHIGHVRYLSEASSHGQILIVGINTDSSVQRLKGPTRPIQNENDRSEILASLKSVSHTILFNEETPLDLIQNIKPDVLVKGGDWKISEIVGSDFVLKNGGKVLTLQFVTGKSTTKIIEKSKT